MRKPGQWGRKDRTAAVSELYAAHYRRLVGLASLLADDRGSAEEVVQEAFFALYRQWRVLRDPSAAVAYLNRCVVNGGRSRVRQGRRQAAAMPLVAVEPRTLASAEQDAMVLDELARVRRQIRALPRRQREVLVLRYYLDQSEAEIAETLGVSRGSVKSYASRALTTLGRALELES
jgi:RNA polymerase sigma-70 factor (sigma-E family)